MSALGLQKSKLFLGGRECPRIVLPILDLIGKDSKWSKSNFTMESLLRNSLEVNSTLKNQFHPCFSQNQDIVKGLQDYHNLWFSLNFQNVRIICFSFKMSFSDFQNPPQKIANFFGFSKCQNYLVFKMSFSDFQNPQKTANFLDFQNVRIICGLIWYFQNLSFKI